MNKITGLLNINTKHLSTLSFNLYYSNSCIDAPKLYLIIFKI